MNAIEKCVILTLGENDKVFFASLLGQMQRIPMPNTAVVPTCGVTVTGGRMYLYWNEQFFESLTTPQQIAVLEHECMHLVYHHVFRIRRRNPTIWNWATDLAINQQIKNLPPFVITLDNMSKAFKCKLPPLQAAEVYYDTFLNHTQKFKMVTNKDGSVTVTRPDGSSFDVVPTDSHENWTNSTGSEIDSLDAEVIKQAIQEAYNVTKNTKRGTLPAGLQEVIEALLRPPTIPWSRQFKNWVGNQVKGHYKTTWKRLSRRMETEDFKGKIKVRLLKIVICIDTSGSINKEIFVKFFSELQGIQRAYKTDLTVIEVDAEVQKEYKLRPNVMADFNVKGRGGTDFRPLFQYVDEKRINPDAMVFFTDLCAAFPEKAPLYPVLWVVPPEAKKYYEHYTVGLFGKVVVIEERGD
jgi:predicted metal-dependent peptidase